MRDKVTGQCPQTTTFLKRKESRSGIEPRSFRLPTYKALPLGRTGSLYARKAVLFFVFFVVTAERVRGQRGLFPLPVVLTGRLTGENFSHIRMGDCDSVLIKGN